jgi:hypothetical protein
MTTVQPTDAVRFRATILLAGKTATGIEVSSTADAGRVFDGRGYGRRLRWVLSVEDAKTDQRRRPRIAKAVEALQKRRS